MNKKINVLIIDDNIEFLNLAKEMLADDNINVSIAPHYVKAQRILLKNKKFDCMIIDVMIPWLNGIDICRAIRKNKKYKKAKIFLISGKSINKDIKNLLKEKLADEFIKKPISFEKLRKKIMQ